MAPKMIELISISCATSQYIDYHDQNVIMNKAAPWTKLNVIL